MYILYIGVSRTWTYNPIWTIVDRIYTAKNATVLLQVVNFTGLLQLVNKLQEVCQFYQVTTSLLKSGLLQLVETACSKPVDNKL